MIDIVIVVKLDHYYTVKLAIPLLRKFIDSSNRIVIISNKKNEKFFKKIDKDIIFLDEDSILPGFTLTKIKELNIYGFPKRAGWYFQQLLKLGISAFDEISEDYLVWDADTIPLKPILLYDQDGKYNFVKADEYHKPYFNNYKLLLGEEPNREFSFISQFMIFNKTIVKELLNKIENQHHNKYSWDYAIMKNIRGKHGSLFSEYETYGHFIKNHYPEKCNFINLPWLREGTDIIGTPFPREKNLRNLSKDYFYVTFESRHKNVFLKAINKLIIKTYPYLDIIFR